MSTEFQQPTESAVPSPDLLSVARKRRTSEAKELNRQQEIYLSFKRSRDAQLKKWEEADREVRRLERCLPTDNV